MKHFILYFSCISLLLAGGIVHAHSGGTDANGGHYNHKTGGYHSHDSGGMETFLVLLGLAILFVVIPIIRELLKGSNSKRQVPTQHRSPRSQPTIDLPKQPSPLPVNRFEQYSTPPPPLPRRVSQPFDYRAGWWRERSEWYRNEKGWTCEECHLCLDADQQYLHTHHIRGTQYNEPEYLKALCIACHSEQPGPHKRLKQMPDYHAFMQKYGQEWKFSMSKRDDGQWADNIASHGNPFYQPQPKEAKKPDEVLPFGKKNEFEGKPLTSDIVETILFRRSEQEESLYFTIREWAEYVRTYHEERGGLSMQGNLVNIVGTSLISLQRRGRARQKSSNRYPSGIWKIF